MAHLHDEGGPIVPGAHDHAPGGPRGEGHYESAQSSAGQQVSYGLPNGRDSGWWKEPVSLPCPRRREYVRLLGLRMEVVGAKAGSLARVKTREAVHYVGGPCSIHAAKDIWLESVVVVAHL